MAEGILQHKIEEQSLDWKVDSAGTSGWHNGEKPDRRAIQTMKEHSIDIRSQRSRKFQGWDFENFDLIIPMDSSNYQDIVSLAKTDEEKSKVKLMLNYSFPGKNMGVPDPYWNDDGFEQVYQLLDAACDVLIEQEQS